VKGSPFAYICVKCLFVFHFFASPISPNSRCVVVADILKWEIRSRQLKGSISEETKLIQGIDGALFARALKLLFTSQHLVTIRTLFHLCTPQFSPSNAVDGASETSSSLFNSDIAIESAGLAVRCSLRCLSFSIMIITFLVSCRRLFNWRM
jgi:hypothetical protein